MQVPSTHWFVQHRARAIVALLTLAVVALVLAACGGDSGGGGGSSSSASAGTLLRQTFTGRHEIRSGKVDVQLRVVAEGDPSINGPIAIGITGPFESAGADELPRFDLALDVSAQGQSFKAGLSSTSDRMFVRFGGTSYEVPAELMTQLKQSYARAQQDGSSQQQMSLAGLGLDPMSWLKDPVVAGTETVGGTETDHITAQLNVSALLDDVDKLLRKASEQDLAGATGQQIPSRLPADTRRQIEEAVKSSTVEVWSGTDDHTLRRVRLALTVEPPASSDGPRSLDLTLTVELTELNEPQSITAPSTTRPLSELLGQFQGLLGGAVPGTGSSGGSGSGGGASSEQLDAYTDCIERAGSDVAEAQKCASLLTR
jgi:hypothetical protein